MATLSAPTNLKLKTNKNSYSPNTRIKVTGSVKDANGFNDLDRVDFLLWSPGSSEWEEIGDISKFARVRKKSSQGKFTYNLKNLSEPGTYWLAARVFDKSGFYSTAVQKSFTILQAAPDNAGNSRKKARNIGNLSGTKSFSDLVNKSDPKDFYRFQIQDKSDVEIVLNGLDGNANLQLLNKRGKAIANSRKGGKKTDKINRTLNASSYYIRVNSVKKAATDYNLTLEATAANNPGKKPSNPPIQPPTSNWLDYVNFYRATANLPPVTENPLWSADAVKHSKYLVKNDTTGHTEDPNKPWYTPEGAEAGGSGNVTTHYTTTMSDAEAIDDWMPAPFHAVAILDPELEQVGFGMYREEDGGIQSAATLDVIRGLGEIPSSVKFPIAWPANGATIPASIRQFTSEWPDPLTSTPGYTAPTGLPIILQLGSGNITPNVTAHSFKTGNTSLEHVVLDETNYTNPNNYEKNLVRGILDSRDAIVLISRDPLLPGKTYTASITANGQKHSWSFNVSTAPPIEGTAGDDVIFGEELDDTITGGAGKDQLMGLAGDDLLNGGTGNDQLYGAEGNDTFIGGPGDDELTGDRRSGESVRDTFVFDAGSGSDRIWNFDVANDVIQVSRSFGLSTADLAAQAANNNTGFSSEITLSPGNTIEVLYNGFAPPTANNFTIV
ncbi:MAG: hypothetical protein F6K40_01995 [Okeania sp. SIO3I5]|uniref:CAP domain-containing protein n=1 Tax=Okeania sp. SIO3I5 TaxID=2607805 RepID=UPI0013B6E111|nr:CAP domain-containing protein [Okeania sp. SIO3I5]NEQ35145.1 hypothetical protein [Okeania sp. SIO3I5]